MSRYRVRWKEQKPQPNDLHVVVALGPIGSEVVEEVVTGPPPPFVITPGYVDSCEPADEYVFTVAGGVPPYWAYVGLTDSVTTPTITPNIGMLDGGSFVISNLTAASTTTVVVVDSTATPQLVTAVVECFVPTYANRWAFVSDFAMLA